MDSMISDVWQEDCINRLLQTSATAIAPYEPTDGSITV